MYEKQAAELKKPHDRFPLSPPSLNLSVSNICLHSKRTLCENINVRNIKTENSSALPGYKNCKCFLKNVHVFLRPAMPKFVAVTDPEKALSEQHGDPSMAKHRAWESKQYVTVNKIGDHLLPSAPGVSTRAFDSCQTFLCIPPSQALETQFFKFYLS